MVADAQKIVDEHNVSKRWVLRKLVQNGWMHGDAVHGVQHVKADWYDKATL